MYLNHLGSDSMYQNHPGSANWNVPYDQWLKLIAQYDKNTYQKNSKTN